MWFLGALITALVVMFSTSQLISYIICFTNYPEMVKDIPDDKKYVIYSGITLHSIINLVWLILVCVIQSIREYWWVCLLVAGISILISVVSVKNDPNLKDHFAKLTDYRIRSMLQEHVDYLQKNKVTEKESNVTCEQVKNEDDNCITKEEEKKLELEKMFRITFSKLIETKETTINGKKSYVYIFTPFDMGTMEPLQNNHIHILVEVGVKNPRYFALEYSHGMFFYAICEWVFENGREVRHILYQFIEKYDFELRLPLYTKMLDLTKPDRDKRPMYERFVDEIKKILTKD